MTQFSAKAAIPFAELTDAPNMQTYSQGLSTQLDSVTISKYALAADRDTANPSPEDGDLCYYADYGEYAMYRQTVNAWTSVNARVAIKGVATARTSNAVATADPELFLAVEGSSVYLWETVYIFSAASDTPGFRVAWTGPTGYQITSGWITPAAGTTSFNVTSVDMAALTKTASPSNFVGGATSSSPLISIGRGVLYTANAGTFTSTWAQGTSSGSATTLNIGSTLSLTKIG